jgi:hypothetical protein
MLKAFIRDNFVRETERFGNIYLGTGKLHQHMFELEIESMHVMPLALAFWDSQAICPCQIVNT